jgi:serine/threonine protein kinase
VAAEKVDLSGEVLDGRYRVIEPVAEGAMGVVYRAERVKLGRIVAIKVLHDVLPSELSSRKRFEIEAMAMAKLEHPHCAAVLDVGVHDGRPFVVMDFVSGKNLKQMIGEGPMAIPRAVEIVRQVLSGLAHAHEHGIIHRDIKPANIVLSQKAGLGDHVKILDFGLARVSQDSSLTTGIVVGTPSYMAPEQIRGLKIDARVDVYACGIVLFELLTGKKPFYSKKDDPIEVCSLHLKAPIPRMSDVAGGKDFGPLEEVVARALAKNPDERYASAVAFANALDEIVPRRGVLTPAAGVPVLSTPAMGVPSVSGTAIGIGAFKDSGSGRPASVTTPLPPDHGRPDSLGSGPSQARSFEAVTNSGDLTNPARSIASSPHDPARASTDPLARSNTTQPAPEPEESLSIAQAGAPLATPKIPARARTTPPKHAPKRGAVAYAPTEPSSKVVDDSIGRPGGPRFSRGQLVIGAVVVLAIAGLIGLVATRTEGKPGKAARTSDAGTKEPAEIEMTPDTDPVGDVVSRASHMLANGQREKAIDTLLAARKAHPKDARLPFLAGKAFFSKFWWNDGLKQFREAIKLDPGLKNDPELIKTVLRGFITTPRYESALGAFLREDIGRPAKPFLQETATSHPNPNIRQRASNELKRFN